MVAFQESETEETEPQVMGCVSHWDMPGSVAPGASPQAPTSHFVQDLRGATGSMSALQLVVHIQEAAWAEHGGLRKTVP